MELIPLQFLPLASTGAGLLYEKREFILKTIVGAHKAGLLKNILCCGIPKAKETWRAPRKVPNLKVSGLLMSNKSGKTHLTNELKNEQVVAFIDVDRVACQVAESHCQKSEELREIEACKSIRELVSDKKKTFKHVVLVGSNYDRLKRCGSQRMYLFISSPQFIKHFSSSSEMNLKDKEMFYLSHSMMAYMSFKYMKRDRCIIYDSMDDLVKVAKTLYEIEDVEK